MPQAETRNEVEALTNLEATVVPTAGAMFQKAIAAQSSISR
jgi:hypothetical protein